MEQITLMKAVLALFRQNLNREQIIDELKIDGKKLDEEMDLFFISPVPNQEKESAEESNLPFDFNEKYPLLIRRLSSFSSNLFDETRIINRLSDIFLWELVIMKISTSKKFKIADGLGKKSKTQLIDFIEELELSSNVVFSKDQLKKLRNDTTNKI